MSCGIALNIQVTDNRYLYSVEKISDTSYRSYWAVLIMYARFFDVWEVVNWQMYNEIKNIVMRLLENFHYENNRQLL